MPTQTTVKRSAQSTRQRILEAAIVRFSQHSYEEARLRDIAADAGVDVALVHRSFGSKAELFREVIQAASRGKFLVGGESADPIKFMAADLFRPRVDSTLKLVDPLDIIVRSLSSEQASPILREFILREFIEPLTVRPTSSPPQRAALAIACLAGVAILRDVLGIEPLLEGRRTELQPLIEKILRACLAEDDEVGQTTSPSHILQVSR